eukprot:365526-Chlamydomonas_euryale.AAC.22
MSASRGICGSWHVRVVMFAFAVSVGSGVLQVATFAGSRTSPVRIQYELGAFCPGRPDDGSSNAAWCGEDRAGWCGEDRAGWCGEDRAG